MQNESQLYENDTRSLNDIGSNGEIQALPGPDSLPKPPEPESPDRTDTNTKGIYKHSYRLKKHHKLKSSEKEARAKERTSKRMIRLLASIAVNFAVHDRQLIDTGGYSSRKAEQAYLQRLWNKYTRRELGIFN